MPQFEDSLLNEVSVCSKHDEVHVLPNDPCIAHRECSVGYGCVPVSGDGASTLEFRCHKWCLNNSDCPANFTCKSFTPEVIIGGNRIGYCDIIQF